MIKQVRADYNAPEIEKEIQKFWKDTNAYEKTKEYRSKGKDFYFCDGPPYTTGKIHLGTAMNKTVKDIMIRYWRMTGLNVRDQPGFDMHGLPIEVQVEKKIGVHSKKEIEENIGIDKFVQTCKKYALDLRVSMTEEFKQLGVWMDWDNPYQTLELSYLESAWWTLSRANERGLLIDADRVVTWCPRCETALAEAEIEYWDESDPSLIVRMPIVGQDCSLLIWTTTPWTLPSNMAVAVHPDYDYAKVKMKNDEGSENVIVLESQIEYVMNQGKYTEFETLEKMKGQELEGTQYAPPFDIGDQLVKSEWVYKVVTAQYVEKDNTGLVHTAPGFGPDDYDTGKRYGMTPFCPVGEDGRFDDSFTMMTGRKVRGVNDDIIKHLDENDKLFQSGRLMHRYGHCWRCKSPIIYRDTRQWFLDVPALKDKMLDEIGESKWVPSWAGDSRQRNWVEGARQWCISRQRYWGIPMPVWECECGEKRVIGTYSELKEGDGYVDGMDTHRPWIDKVTFECPKCKKTMYRVPDVLDVWFDSGVASWAQLGYPSKNEEFDRWWPADFIVEAHDQTRGWFYSQLGAGVISFDHTPYKEVMMHGWVLDPKGQKMSKSKGNVIEPLEIINQVGADSLRLYLIKSNAPWEDTAFQKDGPKNARRALNTYWNVVNFASTYMNLDGYEPEEFTFESIKDSLRDEDLWMLSRTESMKRDVTEYLETRELHKVARSLEDYIMEDLSRWYVRLVRDRTWTEDEDSAKDKNASYFTLHYAIMSTAIVLAPIAPHISEEVYQHMSGNKLTVHMENWPVCNEDLINTELEHSMALIQNIVDIVASERSKVGSKLRWPLLGIYIRGNDEKVNDSVKIFDHVLAQQANIKNLKYILKDEVPDAETTSVPFNEGNLFIDFSITPEIESEGYARELIRRIQQMRKDMKLNVEQFINCDVKVDPRLVDLLSSWSSHISSEVRANTLTFTDSPGGDEVKTWDVTGEEIIIGISSAE
ncbi:MAG TPA: isoleucine--tRNA ligase [Candidatus Methanomethylophilaceae archaeon]|nr:isoleucine--tRNA ligase [Candidatus Methanomethylophilaceae archaeon]